MVPSGYWTITAQKGHEFPLPLVSSTVPPFWPQFLRSLLLPTPIIFHFVSFASEVPFVTTAVLKQGRGWAGGRGVHSFTMGEVAATAPNPISKELKVTASTSWRVSFIIPTYRQDEAIPLCPLGRCYLKEEKAGLSSKSLQTNQTRQGWEKINITLTAEIKSKAWKCQMICLSWYKQSWEKSKGGKWTQSSQPANSVLWNVMWSRKWQFHQNPAVACEFWHLKTSDIIKTKKLICLFFW